MPHSCFAPCVKTTSPLPITQSCCAIKPPSQSTATAIALHEMVAHGVPVNVAHWMILGGQVLQVIASIGLIFGIYPRLAALALILFLIPATLMAHAFWKVMGTPLYSIQVINFCKNVCMAGGLLLVATWKSCGQTLKPGSISRR